MISDDVTVSQIQALLNMRRMTARDLATAAYYHAFEKPIPHGERERVIRQIEGKSDSNGGVVVEPLPRYILAFL